MNQDITDAFHEFGSWQHHKMATAPAFDAYIHARTGNLPFIRATGMRLFIRTTSPVWSATSSFMACLHSQGRNFLDIIAGIADPFHNIHGLREISADCDFPFIASKRPGED